MDKFNEGDKVKVIEGGYTGTEGIIERKAVPSCRVHEGQESYHVISTKVVGFSYRDGTIFIFSVDQLEHLERRVEGQMVHTDDVIKGDLIRVETDDEDMYRQYKGEVFSINTRYDRLVISTERGRVLFNSQWKNKCKITLIKKGNPPHPLEGAKKDFKFKADNRLYTKYKGNLWILDHYSSSGDFIDSSMVNDSSARDGFDLFNGKVL